MQVPARNSLHLFLSPAVNESRLFKEAAFSLQTAVFSEVHMLGLWEPGLAEQERHSSGLSIVRVKLWIRQLREEGKFAQQSLARQLLAAFGYLEYAFAAYTTTLRLKPTHISVHNAALLPTATVIKWLLRKKLVYLPHELESERTGLGRLGRLFTNCVEWAFIRQSVAVVVVCEPIAEWYRAKYPSCDVRVIRNVPSKSDVENTKPVPFSFRTAFGIDSAPVIFIYQGLIEASRGAADLVAAFCLSGHHLVFMGYGGYVSDILANPMANVHYQPAVPINEITRYSAGADVGIFVVNGPLSVSYTLCLPNKFFEYLHAGLPVIVSDNMTYLAGLVKQFGLGWVVKPDSLPDVINRISHREIKAFKTNVSNFAKSCLWEIDAQILHEVYSNE